jgi:hypothetical protein
LVAKWAPKDVLLHVGGVFCCALSFVALVNASKTGVPAYFEWLAVNGVWIVLGTIFGIMQCGKKECGPLGCYLGICGVQSLVAITFLVAASTCKLNTERNSRCPKSASTDFYVRRALGDSCENPGFTGSAFSVEVDNAHRDVDHLKKAVKTAMSPKYPALVAPDVRICKEENGRWAELTIPETVLIPNTEDTLYAFLLPSTSSPQGSAT